jgi:hypothetical protein
MVRIGNPNRRSHLVEARPHTNCLRLHPALGTPGECRNSRGTRLNQARDGSSHEGQCPMREIRSRFGRFSRASLASLPLAARHNSIRSMRNAMPRAGGASLITGGRRGDMLGERNHPGLEFSAGTMAGSWGNGAGVAAAVGGFAWGWPRAAVPEPVGGSRGANTP